ncbi:MAG: hypothetical protein M0R17_07370 [Candidatus Omnitrophica bacterium]|nr:hypothetical protein [Candidatus Omnitrophota bacterium]
MQTFICTQSNFSPKFVYFFKQSPVLQVVLSTTTVESTFTVSVVIESFLLLSFLVLDVQDDVAKKHIAATAIITNNLFIVLN